jgi:hypothetical protein
MVSFISLTRFPISLVFRGCACPNPRPITADRVIQVYAADTWGREINEVLLVFSSASGRRANLVFVGPSVSRQEF